MGMSHYSGPVRHSNQEKILSNQNTDDRGRRSPRLESSIKPGFIATRNIFRVYDPRRWTPTFSELDH